MNTYVTSRDIIALVVFVESQRLVNAESQGSCSPFSDTTRDIHQPTPILQQLMKKPKISRPLTCGFAIFLDIVKSKPSQICAI